MDAGGTEDDIAAYQDPERVLAQQYDAATSAFERLSAEVRLPFLERLLYHKFFISKRDEVHVDGTLAIVNSLHDHKKRTLNLLKLIYEREFAFSALKILGWDFKEGRLSTLEVQTRVLQLLYTLQQATLRVVEAMTDWRSGLTRPYPFSWKGVNYISKIIADSQFLDESNLARVLPLQLVQHPLCSNLNSLSLFSGGAARPGSATFPLKTKYVGTTPPELQARLQQAETAVYDERGTQERLLRELTAISASGSFVPLLRLPHVIPNCTTGVRLTNAQWVTRYDTAIAAAREANDSHGWMKAREKTHEPPHTRPGGGAEPAAPPPGAEAGAPGAAEGSGGGA